MQAMTLIGNSGIQFIDLVGRFADGEAATKISQSFCELEHEDNAELVFATLSEDGRTYLDTLTSQPLIDPKTREPVREDLVRTVSARRALECFEGFWLPVPYFRNGASRDGGFEYGPLTWARLCYQPLRGGPRADGATHSVVLAFDTAYAHSATDTYVVPMAQDLIQSSFGFASKLDDTMGFLSEPWVMQWACTCFQERRERLGLMGGGAQSHLQHMAFYATLLRVLAAGIDFPDIRLHDGEKDIEVDLVLDVGNSRTCGILFQSTEGEPVTFNANASRLCMRDLSQPDIVHEDAFPMHVEFVKASFGPEGATSISSRPDAFDWPSPVRLGNEAVRRAVVSGSPQYPSGMSSPKRYLWDVEARDRDDAWRFNRVSDDIPHEAINTFTVSFTKEGTLRDSEGTRPPATSAVFSRASLMTFVFTELIMHAMTQINSVPFRTHHGRETRRRSLRRVVVTCPTAMLEREKVALRRHARHAIDAIRRHFRGVPPFDREIRVLPDPDDIEVRLQSRQEWGFDEATCAQLVFVYGEIHSRFGGDVAQFAQTYGRTRKSNPDHRPSVRVASVDIGGGTTDVMVCTYSYDASSPTPVVRPKPEFWEGFNLAGDDIAKKVIERSVLPAIGAHAEAMGCGNASVALNMLFGENYGEQSAGQRLDRRAFANQVAMPLALEMIRHAAERGPGETRTYKSFFERQPTPQRSVERYVENQIEVLGGKGFRLADVTWTLDYREVEMAVRQVMQRRIAALCNILSQYNCDLVLLAGRPTLLPIVRDLFVSFLPVTPDRIVNLGNYRIGNWYPFSDARGVIHDPKTCVAVGASVALMAGTLCRLERFRLDTSDLRSGVHSTAAHIGPFNPQHQTLDETVLSVGEGDDTAELTFNGDMFLGFRQLPAEGWISSPIFKLRFAPGQAEPMRNRLPLTVTLRRDATRLEQREKVHIAGIVDARGQQVDSRTLELRPQSQTSEQGHWLDTGSFFLSKF